MAWIRWRTARDGRRLATLQWRDEKGVHSKSLPIVTTWRERRCHRRRRIRVPRQAEGRRRELPLRSPVRPCPSSTHACRA
jgi:hypothetical protein